MSSNHTIAFGSVITVIVRVVCVVADFCAEIVKTKSPINPKQKIFKIEILLLPLCNIRIVFILDFILLKIFVRPGMMSFQNWWLSLYAPKIELVITSETIVQMISRIPLDFSESKKF